MVAGIVEKTTSNNRQAAAAVGQISLAHAYQELANARGLTAAQVLLTLGDTEERKRYLNARRTIEVLLSLKAIPVVNENDTVATDEIRFGDNDRLSAEVALLVEAVVCVGLLAVPPVADVLGGTWPGPIGWAGAALTGVLVVLADAAVKRWAARRR